MSRTHFCSLPAVAEPTFGPDVGPNRFRLLVALSKKWVNGTVLRYYFFDQPSDAQTVVLSDGSRELRSWTTTTAEQDVVREAFQRWVQKEIGIQFKEVDARDEAEIRIGFMRGDGAWSYIGRDVLLQGRDKRTMNFGWDLVAENDVDTAIHEIGHSLGFPHEHQNPQAGIVWDEEAVYAALAKPPNSWDRQKTFANIISKIDPDEVQGSSWDPNSIMHYPFGANMILQPAEFKKGLQPAGGLSARDTTWVKSFYPPLHQKDEVELVPFVPRMLDVAEGEQKNLVLRPKETRSYKIGTFGESDTVMVLFEDVNGELRYRMADDDGGKDFNASMKIRLVKGRRYVLRVRLYWSDRKGETAVMMW